MIPEPPTQSNDWHRFASDVFRIEADAITALSDRLDESFSAACELLLSCSGRAVVCGVGKSGHIANKIAATLSSTGTPAFFLHAAEAMHGDLGMLRPDDVVIAISQSGTSDEILALLPSFKHLGCQIISLSGNANSPLVNAATVALDVGVEREACPLGLAPSASTTATLAMGDALAIALLCARGFDKNDFARSHPGGRLGRRLLMRVADLMATGDSVPTVPPDAKLIDALLEISNSGLGMVAVVDNAKLVGVFTDGDLRRTIERGEDVREVLVASVMTANPLTGLPEQLAIDALDRMQKHKITSLPVVSDGVLEGVVTMHQLLQSGVV